MGKARGAHRTTGGGGLGHRNGGGVPFGDLKLQHGGQYKASVCSHTSPTLPHCHARHAGLRSQTSTTLRMAGERVDVVRTLPSWIPGGDWKGGGGGFKGLSVDKVGTEHLRLVGGMLTSDVYKMSHTKVRLVTPIDNIQVLGIHHEVLMGDLGGFEGNLPLWVVVQIFQQGARRGRQCSVGRTFKQDI